MAQTDDIELKDLLLEAMEKNGSLAKIRGFLRASVFSAFEDECENKKHNIVLDKILNSTEGIVALSIVHEFLECLNMKNTLFVYTAESRQGNSYKYSGRKILADKLNIPQRDAIQEPLLMGLIKKLNKMNPRKFYNQGDLGTYPDNRQLRDDQNSTYIVHEDSTTTSSSQSTSQSENSSDERNQLQLRLQLDNSDTDTSSDSARDKSRSEYVPNDNIMIKDESEEDNKSNTSQQSSMGADQIKSEEHDVDEVRENKLEKENLVPFSQYHVSGPGAYKNSEPISYAELKMFNKNDEKLLNTTGLPLPDETIEKKTELHSQIESNQYKQAKQSKSDSSATLSNASSIHSLNTNNNIKNSDEKATSEYSYDFSKSPNSKHKDSEVVLSPSSIADTSNNLLTMDSPHQHSHSTRSSVSISDVADLVELSEANSPHENIKKSENQPKFNKKTNETDFKLPSHSEEVSGSPIPSISNLSLDFHSD